MKLLNKITFGVLLSQIGIKVNLICWNIDVINEIPQSAIEVELSIGNNTIRKKIVSEDNNFSYKTRVHPKIDGSIDK